MGSNDIVITGEGTFERRLTIKAKDEKAGMSLDELGAAVQDAMRQGVPGHVRASSMLTWKGSCIRYLTWKWTEADEQQAR
jgi:hypothetical protein